MADRTGGPEDAAVRLINFAPWTVASVLSFCCTHTQSSIVLQSLCVVSVGGGVHQNDTRRTAVVGGFVNSVVRVFATRASVGAPTQAAKNFIVLHACTCTCARACKVFCSVAPRSSNLIIMKLLRRPFREVCVCVCSLVQWFVRMYVPFTRYRWNLLKFQPSA